MRCWQYLNAQLHMPRIKFLEDWPVVGQMEWRSFLGALSVLFVLLFFSSNCDESAFQKHLLHALCLKRCYEELCLRQPNQLSSRIAMSASVRLSLCIDKCSCLPSSSCAVWIASACSEHIPMHGHQFGSELSD